MKAVSAMLIALVTLSGGHAWADDAASSLYQLELQLTDQSSRAQQFDLYRGQPTLVTMFYGSCPMACPLLIDTLRAVENALAPAGTRTHARADGFDRSGTRHAASARGPREATSHRSPALDAGARRCGRCADAWAALNTQYRRLPSGEYNHTSVITLLGRDGQMLKQTSTVGRADPELMAAIRAELR